MDQKPEKKDDLVPSLIFMNMWTVSTNKCSRSSHTPVGFTAFDLNLFRGKVLHPGSLLLSLFPSGRACNVFFNPRPEHFSLATFGICVADRETGADVFFGLAAAGLGLAEELRRLNRNLPI